MNNYVLESKCSMPKSVEYSINNYNTVQQNMPIKKQLSNFSDNLENFEEELLENDDIEIEAIVTEDIEEDVWEMLRKEPKDDNERENKFKS